MTDPVLLRKSSPSNARRSTFRGGRRSKIAAPKAISDHLRIHADDYFPEYRGQTVEVDCTRMESREVSTLYHYVLSVPDHGERVVVKVALATPRRRYDRRLEAQARDIGAQNEPEPHADYEYKALLAIEEFFTRKGDQRFGTVHPFDHIISERAMVLANRNEPTLMGEVLRFHRLRCVFSQPQLEQGFRNIGSWLRNFHSFGHSDQLVGSLTTRDQVNASILRMTDELAKRDGVQPRSRRRFLKMVHSTTEQLALSVLPEELPIALAHGDFGPHNVFVDATSRVIVFDTLGRMRMAPYRDIAYFLFVLKSLTTENFRRRIFYEPDRISSYEKEFLAGYFQDENIPIVAIRLFEIQVCLQLWLARVESQERAAGIWKIVKKVRMALRERAFMAYIRRLLKDASDSNP